MVVGCTFVCCDSAVTVLRCSRYSTITNARRKDHLHRIQVWPAHLSCLRPNNIDMTTPYKPHKTAADVNNRKFKEVCSTVHYRLFQRDRSSSQRDVGSSREPAGAL